MLWEWIRKRVMQIMWRKPSCCLCFLCLREVAGIYPIPPMAEYVDEWAGRNEKYFDVPVTNWLKMQSAKELLTVHGS